MEHTPPAKAAEDIGRLRNILSKIAQLNWFLSCCAALLVFVIIRGFFLDIVVVNGPDMEASYAFHDVLLVRKCFNTYDPHDVICFRHPARDTFMTRDLFVQRIVGMPGDMIEVRNKATYINGFRITDTATLKHNYFIQTREFRPDSMFRVRYGLREGGQVSDGFDYCYALTAYEALALKRDSMITSVAVRCAKEHEYDPQCYPHSPQYRWNMDQYGKLYVPKHGDTLTIDTVTVRLYGALLTSEKNKVAVHADTVLINGKPAKRYGVKSDYYFVMGDNRDNAGDSRLWGLLPGSCITGKVIGRLRRGRE